jgi:hypothetical protein
LVFCAPPRKAKASVRFTGTSASPTRSVEIHVSSRVARMRCAIFSIATSHVMSSQWSLPAAR